MKLTASKAEAFVAKPDPKSQGALLYGPDEGLVRERGETLVVAIAGTKDDPFRIAVLTPDDLKDGARLMDEARALPFGGGRRVVRVRGAVDSHADMIAAVLDEKSELAFLVVEAGELGPRSKLRSLFEGAPTAAAIACYADEGSGLAGTIARALNELGIKADHDALAMLGERLGGDRQLLRRELEKLATYVGEGGTATADDVAEVVGDSGAVSLDAVTFAAASGDGVALDRALERTFAEGNAPISVLRAMGRHLVRLHLARAYMREGMDAKAAMMRLKPAPIFKVQPPFMAQLRIWSEIRLARAFEVLTEAELDCKKTGYPDLAITTRALMRIAAAARTRG